MMCSGPILASVPCLQEVVPLPHGTSMKFRRNMRFASFHLRVQTIASTTATSSDSPTATPGCGPWLLQWTWSLSASAQLSFISLPAEQLHLTFSELEPDTPLLKPCRDFSLTWNKNPTSSFPYDLTCFPQTTSLNRRGTNPSLNTYLALSDMLPNTWESEGKSVSHSVVSDSLWPLGLQPIRLLCPWNSSGKNTGVVSHSLLQGIFLTQGSNPVLLHCRQILYLLSHQGNVCKYLLDEGILYTIAAREKSFSPNLIIYFPSKSVF